MVVPQWLKKSLVILLSIMTLGLVSPDDFHWQDEAAANSKPQKKSSFEETKPVNEFVIPTPITTEEEPFDRDKQIEGFVLKAEENCYLKFGDRIKPRIENEFKDIILPKMEEAISEHLQNYPEEHLSNLVISEKPSSSATGEKIFNIYDKQTGQDIIRFHVRRENPPQQGYWFNFHYHTKEDDFLSHHDLGAIYWDKNTPPAWNKQLH
ncbi:YpjP family protein [Bacillus sp. JJ722]|uniref:YpjP family protein n=1 Tax=Bacillus sp. JJ722 TaxID=3122973 RepID=UPI002FFF5B2E